MGQNWEFWVKICLSDKISQKERFYTFKLLYSITFSPKLIATISDLRHRKYEYFKTYNLILTYMDQFGRSNFLKNNFQKSFFQIMKQMIKNISRKIKKVENFWTNFMWGKNISLYKIFDDFGIDVRWHKIISFSSSLINSLLTKILIFRHESFLAFDSGFL